MIRQERDAEMEHGINLARSGDASGRSEERHASGVALGSGSARRRRGWMPGCGAACLLALALGAGCRTAPVKEVTPLPGSPAVERTARNQPAAGRASLWKSSAPAWDAEPAWPHETLRKPGKSYSSDDWRKAGTEWFGTPYRYGAMDRSGIDCSGFVVQMYRQVAGVDLPRTVSRQFRVGITIHPADAVPGDLLFFAGDDGRPGHVAIALNDGNFVHAASRHGVTFSSLDSPYYRGRLMAARRIVP